MAENIGLDDVFVFAWACCLRGCIEMIENIAFDDGPGFIRQCQHVMREEDTVVVRPNNGIVGDRNDRGVDISFVRARMKNEVRPISTSSVENHVPVDIGGCASTAGDFLLTTFDGSFGAILEPLTRVAFIGAHGLECEQAIELAQRLRRPHRHPSTMRMSNDKHFGMRGFLVACDGTANFLFRDFAHTQIAGPSNWAFKFGRAQSRTAIHNEIDIPIRALHSQSIDCRQTDIPDVLILCIHGQAGFPATDRGNHNLGFVGQVAVDSSGSTELICRLASAIIGRWFRC